MFMNNFRYKFWVFVVFCKKLFLQLSFLSSQHQCLCVRKAKIHKFIRFCMCKNKAKKDFLILLPRTNVMTILFQLQSRYISTDANLRYVAMFMHAYLLYTATGNKTKKVKIWCAEQNSIRHFAKCYYCKHVKQMWEVLSTHFLLCLTSCG